MISRVAYWGSVFTLFSFVATAADKPFEAVEIRTEAPIWGEIVVAPLITAGKPALMTLNRDGEGRHRLTIYNPQDEGGWLRPLMRHVALDEDAQFYDIVGTGADRTALIAILSPAAVRLVDAASGVVIGRMPVSSIYRSAGNPELGRLDFTIDLDGDGRDDLLIPDFDGFHLFLQDADGFSAPIFIPIPQEMRISRFDEGVPSYRSFPRDSFDADLDGIKDIVFLRGRSFFWFKGLADGGFAPESHEIDTGLNVVGNRWSDQLESERARSSDANFSETRIETVRDFDGDGLIDILTVTEEVKSTFDRTTRHDLHLGRRGADGLAFSPEPDSTVSLDGFVARREILDLDGDARFDLVTASVDIGLGKIIGALFSGSTNFDASFFRLAENGRLPQKANLVRKLSVAFSFSSGDVEVPVLLAADLSGDGRRDLVLQDGKGRLAVYRGTGDAGIFERRSRDFSISLPKDGQLVSAADLDGDGGEDLLIRFDPRGLDGEEARNRLILLFSR